MTSVLIFALTFIAALSGTSLTQGLLSGVLGILLSTVGLDRESATPRMTFGQIELLDGIPIVATAVDMLAFTEMLVQAKAYAARHRSA